MPVVHFEPTIRTIWDYEVVLTEPEREESPARGILIGLAIMTPIWAAILWGIFG